MKWCSQSTSFFFSLLIKIFVPIQCPPSSFVMFCSDDSWLTVLFPATTHSRQRCFPKTTHSRQLHFPHNFIAPSSPLSHSNHYTAGTVHCIFTMPPMTSNFNHTAIASSTYSSILYLELTTRHCYSLPVNHHSYTVIQPPSPCREQPYWVFYN